jgi:phage repressor protein C with HTH and peptisase S24 domain
MSPYLNDKDIVFIDTSVKEVVGERTFAIMLGGALLIKNLQVLSGNTIRAWAFSNEYPNITINKESDDVEIIGMVVACFRQF